MCVRIAVFSVTVFYDERVVIVAEQRPDASEEDSFQWMSRVLQVNHLMGQHRTMYNTTSLHLICSTFSPWKINFVYFLEHTITTDFVRMFGFLCRLSTASIRWASTVWLWSRPTPYLKRPWVASTSLTPSSSSWTATCIPATS